MSINNVYILFIAVCAVSFMYYLYFCFWKSRKDHFIYYSVLSIGDYIAGSQSMILTFKQCRIVSLLANGYTYKEIQNLLGMASSTLKYHMSSIKNALGCRTKEQVVAICISKGIVKIDEY